VAEVTDNARRAIATCFALLVLGCGSSAAQEPSRSELLEAARAVMAAAPFASLANTDADGRPVVRAMDPASPDDGFVIFMATNPESRKVGQFEADPRAALHYLDPAGPGYVTLHGAIEVVRDADRIQAQWKEAWTPFYPDPTVDAALMRFVPDSLEVVSVPHGADGDPDTWRAHVVDLSPGASR